jgi:hypothetical protein
MRRLTAESRKALQRWVAWRQRREFLVQMLAVLGAMFWVAAVFPERVNHRLVTSYATLWVVVLVITLGALGQEWRWTRVLMRNIHRGRPSEPRI